MTPAKPRERIRVVECGRGKWDERDDGLDYPEVIEKTDFRVTGTGDEGRREAGQVKRGNRPRPSSLAAAKMNGAPGYEVKRKVVGRSLRRSFHGAAHDVSFDAFGR